MNFKQRNIGAFIEWRLYMLLINLVIWNVMLRFFLFLNYLVNPDIFTNGQKIFQIIYTHPFSSVTGIASAVAIGSWIIEDLLFYKFLSRRSMGAVFILRAVFTFSLVVLFTIALGVYHYRDKQYIDFYEYLNVLRNFIQNNAAIYLFTIGIIISVFANFLKAIRQKVGHENFYKIISGYYKVPREEERIFIFIDLISSTQYAELLGHKRYSSFLQECFHGLGLLQVKYRGSQYQFVGDEVVISWSAKRQRNYRNVVDFYYEFTSRLKAREKYFQKKFGLIPRFTASINSGRIMIAEVGDFKSEIAFHGDVLNTAARIQKQCKSYNRELLVTENFINHFYSVSKGYTIDWIAKETFTGKQRQVNIYAVQIESETKTNE